MNRLVSIFNASKNVTILDNKAIPIWMAIILLAACGAGAAAGTVLSGKVSGDVPIAVSQALLCEKPIWLDSLAYNPAVEPQQVYMHYSWVRHPNRSFAASGDDNTSFQAAAELAVGDWAAFNLPLKNASNVALVGQLVMNVPQSIEVEVFSAVSSSHVTEVVRTGFNTWYFILLSGSEYVNPVDSLTILISIDDDCIPGYYSISGTLKQMSIGAGISSSSSGGLPFGTARYEIVTNNIDNTVNIINTSTSSVAGPFLSGQLGTNPISDVAVTPDGRTALIANYRDNRVYFVDVSNPGIPTVLGSVTVNTNHTGHAGSGNFGGPESLVITSDGRFALVIGAWGDSDVVSLNISSRSVVNWTSLPSSPAGIISGVAVAPNGTVVAADGIDMQLFTLTVDGSGNISAVTNTYSTAPCNPWNVGIAPDGQTVVVCNKDSGTVAAAIFQVNGSGILTARGTISGLPGNQTAVAFNETGSKAYILSVALGSNKLSVLDISAPGTVSLNSASAATLNYDRVLWGGVHSLAVANNVIYVAATPSGAGQNKLVTINAGSWSNSELITGSSPTSIAPIY